MTDTPSLETVQAHFAEALPRINERAAFHFRNYRPEAREEAIASCIALTWKGYLRLCERDKPADDLLGKVVDFSARQVREGRRIDGQPKAKDVMSKRAQRNGGFFVAKLPEELPGICANDYTEALSDNARTPVPEQVAFRVDFPEWLDQLPEKKRAMVKDMMMGDATGELAEKHAVSPARISQVRREAFEDWESFTSPRDRELGR